MLIDDSTNISGIVNPTGFDGRGRLPRDYSAQPIGYGVGNAGKYPDHMRIPRKNWKDMIRERKAKSIGLRPVRKASEIGVLDQNGTNFCWFNAPTQVLMLARAVSNLPHVKLSPASGAAQIKNFRNQGGWGSQAFEWLHEKGCNTVETWPANYWKDRKYLSDASKAEALDYRIVEYWDFEPRDLEAVVSSLLHNLPGAAGLNWWGHEVAYIDLDWDDKADDVLIDFDNSWGRGWGDDGAGKLAGSKRIPDDYCCLRTTTL